MSTQRADADLGARAELFKALGHPVRLLILNLVEMKPRHGEELATILKLSPGTISHHVSKLAGAGLLNAKKDQYYQTYTLAVSPLKKTLGEIVRLPQPELAAGVQEDAYRTKVLSTFIKQGRVERLPAQLKKRRIILEKIVQEFEPERRYSMREVNLVLLDYSDDVAALRRGLIDHHLMEREEGVYWRVFERPESPSS